MKNKIITILFFIVSSVILKKTYDNRLIFKYLFSNPRKIMGLSYVLLKRIPRKDKSKITKRPMPFLKSNKIVIIGGGPAGIHMAMKLKERGYNDITVLEKEKWIGGKTLTNHYGKNILWTGATAGVGHMYEKHVDPLIKKYGVFKNTFINKNAKIFYDNKYSDFYTWLLKGKNSYMLLEEMVDYAILHKQYYGQQENGFLVKKDGVDYDTTFGKWLDDNNLPIFRKYMYIWITGQGYGKTPDDISLYFGLTWCLPSLITKPIKFYDFQQLLEEIIVKNNIRVKFNTTVNNVSSNNKVDITNTLLEKEESIDADFVIYACDVPIKDKSKFKHNYFSKIFFSYEKNISELKNVNFINTPESSEFIWIRNDIAMTQENLDKASDNGIFCVGLIKPVKKSKIIPLLKEYLSQLGFDYDYVSIIDIYQWKYFNRFKKCSYVEDQFKINLESKKNWFISSNVYFESVAHVFGYNNRLLNHFL